jgi:hypothetical protein
MELLEAEDFVLQVRDRVRDRVRVRSGLGSA